jgi:hypothetical protein
MESLRNITRDGRVSLIDLKQGFSTRFPRSPLTQILLLEPDIVTISELLAKTQTWLSILENKKRDGNE